VPFEEEDDVFLETPPARRGGTAASLAAAAGRPLHTPPEDGGGFEEIVEEEQVETVSMEQAWMPRGSLPPAAEMPSRISSAPKPDARSPTPDTGAQTPDAGVAWGRPTTSPDMWEEEEEDAGWEEEPADTGQQAAGSRQKGNDWQQGAGSRQQGTAPGTRYPAPGTKGVSPLDQMLFMPNTKVTRTDEERRPKGPPAGWAHPRPAELMREAPPPPRPSRPSSRDEVVPTAGAVKPVPPSAQKLTKKDREKMGAMLDDLLVKSKKR
jgi:hypothetical protein